jgi:hypothetical protein
MVMEPLAVVAVEHLLWEPLETVRKQEMVALVELGLMV